jgi:hypothetical protein
MRHFENARGDFPLVASKVRHLLWGVTIMAPVSLILTIHPPRHSMICGHTLAHPPSTCALHPIDSNSFRTWAVDQGQDISPRDPQEEERDSTSPLTTTVHLTGV